jgi:uncharacterized protein (TIGR02588 family)
MSRDTAGSGRRRSGRILALAEWIVAGLGALFLIGALAHLSWRAAVEGGAPPAISVSAASVTAAKGRYLVRFEALNEGGATAAGVVVKGRLKRGAETVEEAETTLDYAPPRSRRHGVLVFENDPASLQLVLDATGYHEP